MLQQVKQRHCYVFLINMHNISIFYRFLPQSVQSATSALQADIDIFVVESEAGAADNEAVKQEIVALDREIAALEAREISLQAELKSHLGQQGHRQEKRLLLATRNAVQVKEHESQGLQQVGRDRQQQSFSSTLLILHLSSNRPCRRSTDQQQLSDRRRSSR